MGSSHSSKITPTDDENTTALSTASQFNAAHGTENSGLLAVPMEIQDMIWRETAPEAGWIHLKRNWDDQYALKTDWHKVHHSRIQTLSLILHLCKNSRAWALHRYKLVLGATFNQPIYVDPAKDVLVFNGKRAMIVNHADYNNMSSWGMRTVAIEFHDGIYDVSLSRLHFVAVAMQTLEEIIIILPNVGADRLGSIGGSYDEDDIEAFKQLVLLNGTRCWGTWGDRLKEKLQKDGIEMLEYKVPKLTCFTSNDFYKRF